MRNLVIYDTNSGNIFINSPVEPGKTYSGGLIIDIPDDKYLAHIDPQTGEPTFLPFPNSAQEMDDVQLALIELDERVSALEGGN